MGGYDPQVVEMHCKRCVCGEGREGGAYEKPTAALEEALRRTENEAAMAQSSAAGVSEA